MGAKTLVNEDENSEFSNCRNFEFLENFSVFGKFCSVSPFFGSVARELLQKINTACMDGRSWSKVKLSNACKNSR